MPSYHLLFKYVQVSLSEIHQKHNSVLLPYLLFTTFSLSSQINFSRIFYFINFMHLGIYPSCIQKKKTKIPNKQRSSKTSASLNPIGCVFSSHSTCLPSGTSMRLSTLSSRNMSFSKFLICSGYKFFYLFSWCLFLL